MGDTGVSHNADGRSGGVTDLQVRGMEVSNRQRIEGWLCAGEAMAFTNAVTTAVTLRLAANEGRPGAYTPGVLFGFDLAVQAGGRFVMGPDRQ